MNPSSVNIEKIDNKGTINLYVNDANEGNKKENKKNVSIAAVNKYSSPLEAEVSITPWGTKFFRVSASVTNPLFGQRVYEKYLLYDTEDKAQMTMDYIYSVFADIKDEAEIGLKHSAYLIPKIWKKLSNLEATISHNDFDSETISHRFDNKTLDGTMFPNPIGWVGNEDDIKPKSIADIVNVPREYLTKSASKENSKSSFYKVSFIIKKIIDIYSKS